MSEATMALPVARLELALWQAEADAVNSSDLYIRLTEMGLPPEVAIRMKQLLEVIKPIGGKLISIGKIVVLKLIEFVEKHPNLATGIALGAALSVLVGAVPLLGPLLAPIALAIGVTAGAIAGHRMDKAQGEGMNRVSGVGAIAQDVIEIARAFFRLIIETLAAISAELSQ